ncbi:hypothetical protein [Methylobacterium phyllostachyos]|uniref:hypothetical protein n=1 Tax=Methylobacterium phyllostachyos TaxID=582672 RepID=UPI00115F85AF|nr:hypothetical protein [Methylobacterium phyllostachyos]
MTTDKNGAVNWPLAVAVGSAAGFVGAAVIWAGVRKLQASKVRPYNGASPTDRATRFHDLTIDAGNAEETFLVSTQLLRGKIINHFANVEFIFADLHFRARQLSAYSWLSPDLPYTIKKRIASVKALATADGPLRIYEKDLLAIANELPRFEKLRQFVAHGNMLVDFKRERPIIIFHVYDQPKQSQPILSERKNTLQEFHSSYMDLALFSERVIILAHKIITGVPLPPAV